MSPWEHRSPAPRVLMAGARAAWIGPGLDLGPHRSAVATVAVGLEAPFDLALDRGVPSRHRIALVPAGATSRLRTRGLMAFVYLDALDDDVRRIDLARPSETVTAVRCVLEEDGRGGTDARTAGPPDGARTSAGRADAGACLEALRLALGVPPRRSASAPASVVSVLRALDERPQDFPTLAPAAALAGLSTTRLRHLFREITGVPFGRYRTWCRMALVARTLASGADLTTAAAQAGFASSSHLSTAFRQMFGLCPSRLLDAGTRFDIAPPTVRTPG